MPPRESPTERSSAGHTITAAALGGAIVAVVEVVSLRTFDLGIEWVSVTLLVALGVAVGATIALEEWIARRLGANALATAAILATGSAIAAIPLGRGLFDGARAETMPGAAWAPVWVPIAVWLATTATIWGARRFLGSDPWRRRAVAIGLFGLVAVADLGNRLLFRSGYPQIHLAASVVAVIGAAVAVRLLAARRSLGGRRAAAAIAVASVASLISVLAFGLGDVEERWIVATRGVHTRELARVVRETVDLDGDGYSAAIGGPDCDDGDDRVHPFADDPAGDGVDQDCDGADSPPPAPAPRDAAEALSSWLATPAVTAEVERSRERNVLLLSVDALRADALLDTPEHRRALPHLFALLDESHRFHRAFAPSAGTDVSIPGLLTGRVNPFGAVETTLAEAMQRSGRATHAVLPSEALRWVGRTLVTRGLDRYDHLVTDAGRPDVGTYTTSARTTDLGLAFVTRPGAPPPRPFFLWLHYFDVHEHHQIDPDDAALRAVAGGRVVSERAKYDALVALVDREVGRLVAELRRLGEWDRTIVVLTSDHGESLGEDPRFPDRHGEMVYNALVHVPLAIRIPGVPGGSSAEVVSLLDVAPTIASLVGAPALPGADGRTLLPHLLGGAPPVLLAAHDAVLNETSQRGIVVWPYKLMTRPAENLIELYDLSSDFQERRDLAASQPDRVRELLQAYRRYPAIVIDRSRAGRRSREAAGRAPPPR